MTHAALDSAAAQAAAFVADEALGAGLGALRAAHAEAVAASRARPLGDAYAAAARGLGRCRAATIALGVGMPLSWLVVLATRGHPALGAAQAWSVVSLLVVGAQVALMRAATRLAAGRATALARLGVCGVVPAAPAARPALPSAAALPGLPLHVAAVLDAVVAGGGAVTARAASRWHRVRLEVVHVCGAPAALAPELRGAGFAHLTTAGGEWAWAAWTRA